jgi:RNA polymerase primary sigma factor
MTAVDFAVQGDGCTGSETKSCPTERRKDRPTTLPTDDFCEDLAHLTGPGSRSRRDRPSVVESHRHGTSLPDGGYDLVRRYLQEISRVPLLSAAEEVALAQSVAEGLQATTRLADRQSPGGAPDSAADVHDRRLRRQGQVAKQVFIEANLRLVVSIAKRYQNRGMPLLDLIQEGTLGLMHAVDKFDHTKGFRFSTYATWWIRQAVTRGIADQARTIRLPVRLVEMGKNVTQAEQQLYQELGRGASTEEIAQETSLPAERVNEILMINRETFSLDEPLGTAPFTLSDHLEDGSAVSPPEAAIETMLSETVQQDLGQLSERERQIIVRRFGIDNGQAHTLDEVGKEFGLTRERIRQIEKGALDKLRPLCFGRLQQYGK